MTSYTIFMSVISLKGFLATENYLSYITLTYVPYQSLTNCFMWEHRYKIGKV